MRRAILPVLMIIALIMCACGDEAALEKAFLGAREDMAQAERVSFTAEVVAELSDNVFECSLECSREGKESLVEVLKPEEIAGIRARLAEGEREMEFDGLILALPDSDPESVSPLEAMPMLMDAWLDGHLRSVWRESEDGQELAVAEVYVSETEYAIIWMDTENFIPINMELVSGGRTVVKCKIVSFTEE